MNSEAKYLCELLAVDEYLGTHSEKKKYGKYHATNFWNIKGFGQKKWVVGLRVKLGEIPSPDFTDKQIMEACLRYLNTPPAKKKYAKKEPLPKYGHLVFYKGNRIRSESGTDHIFSMLVIVDKQKNKYFWGKGKNV